MISKKPVPIILSLYDCWEALKRGKKTILISAVIIGMLLFVYKLQKPLAYTAEGIFKSNTSATPSNGLAKALEGVFDLKSEKYMSSEDPKTFLLTYPILEEAVSSLNLQGYLSFPQKNGLFRRIWGNLKTEWAWVRYRKRQRPSSAILSGKVLVSDRLFFADPPSYLHLENISYQGELYSTHSILFEDEMRFTLLNQSGEKIALGLLGEPVHWEKGSFTLVKTEDFSLPHRPLLVTWIPLRSAAESLAKSIDVKREKTNPSLVTIRYTHGDRRMAAQVVNAVMLGYQSYLQKEGGKKISKQLKYLATRQKELEKDFDEALELHRQSIEECLGKGHFLSLEEEISFMARTQSECENRLLELTTEIRRLNGPSEKTASQLIAEGKIDEQTSLLAEEYQHLPLSEALELLSEAEVDLEKNALARQKYDEILQKLENEDVELSSYASAFDESILEALFSEIHALSLKLIDAGNWTPKEKERTKKELDTHKQYLRFHLSHLKEGSLVAQAALASKIDALKSACLRSTLSEYALIQKKLTQIGQKSLEFAEKWLLEKKIDLNTTVHAAIVESITKIIEAKNISYHTESIDAAPFAFATLPVFPNSPRLRFSFLIGCFGGAFLAFFFLFTRMIVKGTSASLENLKALGYRAIGSFSSPFLPPLSHMDLEDIHTLRALALSLCQNKEGSKVVLCASQDEMTFLDELIELLSARDEKILWVSINSMSEPGLFSSLEEKIPPSITAYKGFDFLSGGTSSLACELLLFSPQFKRLIEEWKGSYHWIFLQGHFSPDECSFLSLFTSADQILFHVTTETISNICSLPEHTMFTTLPLSNPSSIHKLSLNEVIPFLERLKKNLYNQYQKEKTY